MGAERTGGQLEDVMANSPGTDARDVGIGRRLDVEGSAHPTKRMRENMGGSGGGKLPVPWIDIRSAVPCALPGSYLG